jgi:hypothetical protein
MVPLRVRRVHPGWREVLASIEKVCPLIALVRIMPKRDAMSPLKVITMRIFVKCVV